MFSILTMASALSEAAIEPTNEIIMASSDHWTPEMAAQHAAGIAQLKASYLVLSGGNPMTDIGLMVMIGALSLAVFGVSALLIGVLCACFDAVMDRYLTGKPGKILWRFSQQEFEMAKCFGATALLGLFFCTAVRPDIQPAVFVATMLGLAIMRAIDVWNGFRRGQNPVSAHAQFVVLSFAAFIWINQDTSAGSAGLSEVLCGLFWAVNIAFVAFWAISGFQFCLRLLADFRRHRLGEPLGTVQPGGPDLSAATEDLNGLVK